MGIDRGESLRNAEKLLRQGKLEQAITEYVRVVDEQPGDWNTANVLGDLYVRAGATDKAIAQYTRIADSLTGEGFLQKASALYKKILKIRPGDEHVLLQSGEIAARQGLLVDARAHLNALADRQRARGDAAALASTTIRLASLDPTDGTARLAGVRARVELGDVSGAMGDLKAMATECADAGRTSQAVLALREAVHIDPFDLDAKRSLARLLMSNDPAASADETFAIVSQLANDAVGRADWTGAAAAFEEFLAAVPRHVPTLLRLVEISVDGGLDATRAQAQLADAYLEAGSAAQARFIAEDLVARDPGNPSHRERLRRTLRLLGDSDPEQVIASLVTELDGFQVVDSQDEERGGGEDLPARPLPASEPVLAESLVTYADPLPAGGATPAPERSVSLRRQSNEVDLTVVLNDIVPRQPFPSSSAKDIEQVCAQFRDEASRTPESDSAEQDLKRGIAFYQDGQYEDALSALMGASRSPRCRFQAASSISAIYRERGDTWRAIEWLEQAAEAPAPLPEDGHHLSLQLADLLESVGEVARALAVCLELRADAGDYQDVAERVDRLAKIQARG